MTTQLEISPANSIRVSILSQRILDFIQPTSNRWGGIGPVSVGAYG